MSSTTGRGGGGGGGGWVVLVLMVLLFEPVNADVDFCGGGGGGGDIAVDTDAGMEKRRVDAPTGGGGGGGVVPTATAELASLGAPLRSAARRSATEEVGAAASTSIEPYGRELRRAGGGGGGGWPPVLLALSLAILSAIEIF